MPPAQATLATPPALTKPAPQHKHTSGQTYLFTCPACRAEDKARSAENFVNIPDSELERTTFMVPGNDSDGNICRAYLAVKYPEAPYITSSLNLATLGGWEEGEQIVVLRRDTWPKQPLPGLKRMKDEEGKWETQQVPHETFICDVVEMAPLMVRQVLIHTKADRFVKAKLDIRPLTARLGELMCFPYRPDLPKDPKDTVLNFVFSG